MSKIYELQEEIFYSLKAHGETSIKNNLAQRKKDLKRKREKKSLKQNWFHFSLEKFYTESQAAFQKTTTYVHF